MFLLLATNLIFAAFIRECVSRRRVCLEIRERLWSVPRVPCASCDPGKVKGQTLRQRQDEDESFHSYRCWTSAGDTSRGPVIYTPLSTIHGQWPFCCLGIIFFSILRKMQKIIHFVHESTFVPPHAHRASPVLPTRLLILAAAFWQKENV